MRALPSAGTFNQNLRVFCPRMVITRNCPPIIFCPHIWKTKKSSKIKGNTLEILRRSFFPFNALSMPSFNNSVYLKSTQSIYFKKYRDFGYTCNPRKLEIHALQIPLRDLVNPCRHLIDLFNSGFFGLKAKHCLLDTI